MKHFDDMTWYCHWDKERVCESGLECDECEYQPADDDKEHGRDEPLNLIWKVSYDSSMIPECPACGQFPYDLDRCVFCGQKFLPDVLADEWKKPVEEERIDCPACGGKSTMVGARARSNGHFHGTCTACGATMME